MRLFHCGHCGSLVFFESSQCVHCGSTLAFVREHVDILALQPTDDGTGLWERKLPRPGLGVVEENTSNSGVSEAEEPYLRYQMCANRTNYQACNFALINLPGMPHNALCAACLHTRVLPDLSDPINLRRWSQIESAKRRLYYIDIRLGIDRLPGESGPIFEFLADLPGSMPVMTGHSFGVITLNIAEADDDERVRRRIAFHEPYRTLLGHLRHEIGHYFWDVLIARGNQLDAFRELFGDERLDYGQALQDYYARTPIPNSEWQDSHVSAYATAHPWEDWAETWAHYLQLVDTLDTARSFGSCVDELACRCRLGGPANIATPRGNACACLSARRSELHHQRGREQRRQLQRILARLPACRGQREIGFEPFQHLQQLQRLAPQFIEAAAGDIEAALRGHGHGRHLLATGHLPQQRQQLAAVHVGQAQVEQQQGGVQALGALQRLAGAIGQHQFTVRDALEQRTHQHRVDRVILDIQHLAMKG